MSIYRPYLKYPSWGEMLKICHNETTYANVSYFTDVHRRSSGSWKEAATEPAWHRVPPALQNSLGKLRNVPDVPYSRWSKICLVSIVRNSNAKIFLGRHMENAILCFSAANKTRSLKRKILAMHAWHDIDEGVTTTPRYALERRHLCLSSVSIIKNLQHLVTLAGRYC